MLKAFGRTIYAPLLSFGTIGSGLWLVAGDFPLWSLVLILLLAIVVSFWVERIFPYEPDWNRAKDERVKDILHAIFNEGLLIVAILMIPVLSALAPWPSLWPSQFPLWFQLAISVIIADFGITMVHYASHRFDWLWTFHAPHHAAQKLYGFNGFVKHPVHQGLEMIAGTLPLILLGMPIEIGALLGLAVAIQLLLQHSNVDIQLGILARFWAIAPVHRLHHRNHSGEGDVNFGLFLTIWGNLLGTAAKEPYLKLESKDLGIEGRQDYPKSYWGQLAEPFRHWGK